MLTVSFCVVSESARSILKLFSNCNGTVRTRRWGRDEGVRFNKKAGSYIARSLSDLEPRTALRDAQSSEVIAQTCRVCRNR